MSSFATTSTNFVLPENFFEWIADYDEILPYLKVDQWLPENSTSKYSFLEIGCGTSLVTQGLARDFPSLSPIVSTDSDPVVIENMKKTLVNNTTESSRVIYEVYDILEGPFKKRKEILFPSASSENTSESPEEKEAREENDQHFDIIFDKGTLDYLLIQGVSDQVFYNIFLNLKNNTGIYILFTIFNKELIENIFVQNKFFNDNIKILKKESFISSNASINYYVIQKNFTNDYLILNKEFFFTEYNRVFDKIMKVENPFLTSSLRYEITSKFNKIIQEKMKKGNQDEELGEDKKEDKKITIREVYDIVFKEDDLLGYEYSAFLEDLSYFELKHEGYMTLNEIFQFLEEMQ